MNIFEQDLLDIQSHLNDMAQVHRNTVMPGITHGQHALPITFGFNAAIWSDMVGKHIDRFQEARKRILMGTVSGAVGNFSYETGIPFKESIQGFPEIHKYFTPEEIRGLLEPQNYLGLTDRLIHDVISKKS
jgi:adenylosuccinate lyase